ncbi:MAG TPA: hypothetical protein VE175_13770, partial [Woeseiaceae bacterium]|nr:hypothetical protein [Woeseiaceae bacterium]
PKPLPGSRMVFERGVRAAGASATADSHAAGGPVDDQAAGGPVDNQAGGDPVSDRVMLLTRDAGFPEVALLDFSYQTGPTLFGSREELLAEWRRKLGTGQ